MSCLLILNINHTLRMRITKVALMWRSVVNFVLVERILDFVGEYAGGKT